MLDGPPMYVVTVTQALLDFFWRRRIFHHLTAERWQVGDRLAVPEDCALEPYCQLLAGVTLPGAMGAFSYSNTELGASARIGRYCSIARNVQWMGSEHPNAWVSSSPVFYEARALGFAAFRKERGLPEPEFAFTATRPGVTVGHDVWIGDGAMVAPGVTLGHGCIVGARSLVLNDVPPYAIVVGHPAKVLRYRLREDLIPRFLEIAWWRFAPDALQGLPMDQPESFLDALDERLAVDTPAEFAPEPVGAANIVAASGPA